jgi:hypothetical protein
MTRREVITKAIAKRLSWIQAAEIIGIKPRQMRRIRWRVEHYRLEAVMDQRGGRPRRKRIRPALSSCSAGLTQRLSGFLAAAFLRTRHRETCSESLVQLAAANAAES